MKNLPWETIEGIKVPNLENIRSLKEKGSDTYQGILEADTLNQTEINDISEQERSRKIRPIIKAKQFRRNQIKGINEWSFS